MVCLAQNDVFTSISATIKSVEKPFNQWATLCDYQVSQLRTSDTLIIFFNSNECDTQWVRPENFRSSLSTMAQPASSPFLKPFSTAAAAVDDEFLVVMNRIVD